MANSIYNQSAEIISPLLTIEVKVNSIISSLSKTLFSVFHFNHDVHNPMRI